MVMKSSISRSAVWLFTTHRSILAGLRRGDRQGGLGRDTTMEHQTINGVAAKGGALNGPGAVVAGGGMLFVSSGYASLGFMPGHVLLAYSVAGQ
jgi:hypothetical protein